MMRSCFALSLLPVLLFSHSATHALTQTEPLGDVIITVYAPDWIWQKSMVNVLVTLENTGEESAEIALKLDFPEDDADHFQYGNADSENVTIMIPAGESVRHAFTNIEALGGVERQEYDFWIEAAAGDESLSFPYPLTTIRGPVVSGAKWAMFLPAFICVIWCGAFLVALRRFSEPGAWKVPSELELGDATDAAWMDETS